MSTTLDQLVGESLAGDRFGMVMFGSFAILGLLLAAVGIYGVMAFVVAQRTRGVWRAHGPGCPTLASAESGP